MKQLLIKIASTAHEINRAYCVSLGDYSVPRWGDLPDEQKDALLMDVEFVISNPDEHPSAQHEKWMEAKQQMGWKYGPVRNFVKKEHPCFLAYDQLPQPQKSKDYIFKAVVTQLEKLSSVGALIFQKDPEEVGDIINGLKKDVSGPSGVVIPEDVTPSPMGDDSIKPRPITYRKPYDGTPYGDKESGREFQVKVEAGIKKGNEQSAEILKKFQNSTESKGVSEEFEKVLYADADAESQDTETPPPIVGALGDPRNNEDDFNYPM